jgi:hypothetical protein
MLSQLPNSGINFDICLNILVYVISLLVLLLECVVDILIESAAALPTNVTLCVAERTPTPEVKKTTAFPPSNHKPMLADARPSTLQSTQRPLPPTPGDNKLLEKPNGEL